MKKGKLKVFYGPMYSGKSAYLIKDILENIHTPKLVFKPKGDVRSKKVYTREGLEFEAIAINTPEEILPHIGEWVEKVYIDEINFFGELLTPIVDQILDQGIDVIVSGLDTDYRTDDFIGTKQLLDKADIAVRLTARCHICGNKSSWTARFTDGVLDSKDSETIISDAAMSNVEYKTLCSKCHPYVEE